jgi:hypothetical protein
MCRDIRIAHSCFQVGTRVSEWGCLIWFVECFGACYWGYKGEHSEDLAGQAFCDICCMSCN